MGYPTDRRDSYLVDFGAWIITVLICYRKASEQKYLDKTYNKWDKIKAKLF